jgi:hypothetical protein
MRIKTDLHHFKPCPHILDFGDDQGPYRSEYVVALNKEQKIQPLVVPLRNHQLYEISEGVHLDHGMRGRIGFLRAEKRNDSGGTVGIS